MGGRIIESLFNQEVTIERVKEIALLFCGQSFDIGTITGPVLGNILEKKFIELLEVKVGYWKPKGKHHCDIPHINVDIKALQIKGKRGGAAKIHGYSRGGAPSYDLLLFTYSYRKPVLEIHGVYWISSKEVAWVRAEHYLFSIPDKQLEQWRMTQ